MWDLSTSSAGQPCFRGRRKSPPKDLQLLCVSDLLKGLSFKRKSKVELTFYKEV